MTQVINIVQHLFLIIDKVIIQVMKMNFHTTSLTLVSFKYNITFCVYTSSSAVNDVITIQKETTYDNPEEWFCGGRQNLSLDQSDIYEAYCKHSPYL